ncbi:MAG: IclR family transcriptional regulator [Trebonia sp.]
MASGTEAAARIADVLLMFTDGPASLGVTEIARELGLSKAVVHRILQSLADRSFVAADPVTHEYRLGQGAVALGTRVLRDLDLRRAARLVLRQLRDTTGETTTVSEVTNLSRVYLDQFESPQEIKMTVELGRRHPLHAGASGRAIRAFLPPDTIEQVIGSGLPTLTPETTRSAGRLDGRAGVRDGRRDRRGDQRLRADFALRCRRGCAVRAAGDRGCSGRLLGARLGGRRAGHPGFPRQRRPSLNGDSPVDEERLAGCHRRGR